MTPHQLRSVLRHASAATAAAALALAAAAPAGAQDAASTRSSADAGAAPAPPASASAAARVVLSPRSGATVRRAPVRFAVRAGAERGDLVARLNGVAIGEEFARTRPGLRTLTISSSHGLRHGRNVLRVTARTGTAVRRATVRFTIGHRRPLAGAGRARRTVAGRWVRLTGHLRHHPRARRTGRLRWKVVSAPRGSRLAPAHGRRQAARRGAGRRDAARRRAAPAPGLRRATTLSPAFRPDTPGRYVLQMTAGGGALRSSATVAVDASPRSAVIAFDSAVDGADPAGAQSTEAAAGRPGIRLGGVVYRAPWMHAPSGEQGSFSGSADGTPYVAAWQVLVVHRRTLGLAWNRTYGRCTIRSFGPRACRIGDDGTPFVVDMAQELSQIDNDHLVLAASHPGDAATGRRWDAPATLSGAQRALGEAGLPDDAALLRNVDAGGAAMVGAGGLAPGEAKHDVFPTGRARMAGFLIADVNGHYGYVSNRRETFDTRTESSCAHDGPGGCTYAMTVAGVRTAAVQRSGDAGFVVAVHDDRTLARRDAAVFETGTVDATGAALSMAGWIRQHRQPGAIFAVTSFGRPLAEASRLTREASGQLAEAIASVGGTRHRFNLAVATPGSGYSLIGRGDAEEGEGTEAIGAGARLQGALAPDARSRMKAVNVSADGPPAERLQRLLIAPSSSRWPLDDQPGPRAALRWIGDRVPQLGGDPRQAYWQQAPSTLAAAARSVGQLDAPSGEAFTAADFAVARRQLLLELDRVQATRSYLDLLSRPAGESGATVWEEATRIQNRLEVELRIGQEKAEETVEAFWFGVVRSMLSLAGGAGEWFHVSNRLLALIEVSVAAVEATETGWESDHDGGEAEEIEENPRVRADQLAGTLERQARQTVDGFWRIGNAIVSDPRKLEEVGTWAGCLPNAASGGCAEGYEEYAVTPAATAQATRVARIGLEQVLHQQLVPLTFPVWDTGLSSVGGADAFSCWLDSTNDPFRTAPHLSWTGALEQVASPSTGQPHLSRFYVMLARSGTSYIHPSEELLERMFGPVDLDADRGGLGMSPQETMRGAERRFEPGASCSWER